MTTFAISTADMTSPEIVTIFEQPQLIVFPLRDSTSLPQDLHLTLIDSITLVLFVCTQNNHQLLCRKVPFLYLTKKG